MRFQRETRVSSVMQQRQREDNGPPKFADHEKGSTRTLWVGNLGPSITAKELEKDFGRFGTIVSTDLKHQKSGSTYAFIKYDCIADAAAARAILNGRTYDGFAAKIGYGKVGFPHLTFCPVRSQLCLRLHVVYLSHLITNHGTRCPTLQH